MQDQPDHEQPFLSHLIELRDRLLRVVVAVLAVFVLLFPFQNSVYSYLAAPLMTHLPEGASMIATEVASPFLTPMKLAFVASIFLSMPFILYQFWAFVAPGLYKHERKMVLPLVVSSSVLFYVGMAFAYFVVFPLVFAFLTGTAPEGVAVMTDIGRYLDFVLTLFFAFGLAFEVPIATIILVWMGVTTPESLASKRPYIIVGAFVIGMMLTPPDVISQTLLAVPMWILFEIVVIFSKGFVRSDNPEEGSGETGAVGDEDNGRGMSAAAAASSAETDFEPLTPEQMEEELKRIEEQESMLEPGSATAALEVDDDGDVVQAKLRKAIDARFRGEMEEARTLLYEVLVEGTQSQTDVARNLLNEIDSA